MVVVLPFDNKPSSFTGIAAKNVDQFARLLLASPALPVHPPTSLTTGESLFAQHADLPASVSMDCSPPPRTIILSYNEPILETGGLQNPDTAQKHHFNKPVQTFSVSLVC
ncbi:hypothetical protein CRENBAI_018953 [Crenichthys baileyi]|uniref:Uncharacterized protein n=1 Tax=Crenichthys baileyi TaxID=28760 RepID=A0AAV9SB04_9TELE